MQDILNIQVITLSLLSFGVAKFLLNEFIENILGW